MPEPQEQNKRDETCRKFSELYREFPKEEIKYREVRGQSLAYITARSVMNRLDAVFGPENWEDYYQVTESGRWICRITVHLDDGRSVVKCGASGENLNMSDPSDIPKSGATDAFKTAAVKFGIGRYLYNDGIVNLETGGITHSTREEPTQGSANQSKPSARSRSSQEIKPGDWHKMPSPKHGRALFARIREIEDTFKVKFLNSVNQLVKEQFGGETRIVDLADEDAVSLWHGVKQILDEHFGTESPAEEDDSDDNWPKF